MKDLTLGVVREAFMKQYHSADEEDADRFMALIDSLRHLEDDQILIRANKLEQKHLGMMFSLLGGPILGTLDDVPKPVKPKGDRAEGEFDEQEGLRGYRFDYGYFLVIGSKFMSFPPSQLVVLTEIK